MLNEHRQKCALHRSWCFKTKQMMHDMALCEMILTCQLLVGNWSDLHANELLLQIFFCVLPFDFPTCGELNVHCIHISNTSSDSNDHIFFQWINCIAVNDMRPLKCVPTGNVSWSAVTHAFTSLLYAWVERMTYATCANCSSIMSRTQRCLARE